MNHFWSTLSFALPLTAIFVGILILLSTRSGTGDYAARLGSGVLFLVGIGLAGVLGEIAAIVSLLRGERVPWLAAIGVIANLLVMIPLLSLFIRD